MRIMTNINMFSKKAYSFQESKTILNTGTQKSGNLLNSPRVYIYIYIYIYKYILSYEWTL